MTKSYPRTFSARWVGSSTILSGGSCVPRVDDGGTWAASWTNSTNGVDNPNWRNQIKSGLNATTPFTGTRTFYRVKSECVMTSARATPGIGQICKSSISGTFCGLPSHLATSASSVEASNEAKSRMIREISQKITPFLGGVFLGELRQTLSMLRNPLVSMKGLLGKYDSALLKGRRLPNTRLKRDHLRNAYLEFTFGWTPLAYDVQGALTALRSLREERPYQVEKFTQRGLSFGGARSSKSLSTINLNSIFIQDSTREIWSSWIKAGVRVSSVGSTASVPEVLGFLPKHFLPTAWELVPYSFIVDYFSNIGDIISAWSLIDGYMSWGCETLRHTVRTERQSSDATLTSFPFGDVKTSQFRPDVVELFDIDTTRDGLGTLVPSLRFELPDFGSRQSLNVATILHQIATKAPYY